MTNKFNIHWQIVRVEARAFRKVDEKLIHVMEFLEFNRNKYNYDRVLNWLKMTGVAYDGDARAKFEIAAKHLQERKDVFASDVDNDNDLSKVPLEKLEMVLADLKKRKYGFQFKNVPKDHVAFVEKLEHEINLSRDTVSTD